MQYDYMYDCMCACTLYMQPQVRQRMRAAQRLPICEAVYCGKHAAAAMCAKRGGGLGGALVT
jgi:hypothetical protein